MITSLVLMKYEDSLKIQKPKYLEKEKFFPYIKKSIHGIVRTLIWPKVTFEIWRIYFVVYVYALFQSNRNYSCEFSKLFLFFCQNNSKFPIFLFIPEMLTIYICFIVYVLMLYLLWFSYSWIMFRFLTNAEFWIAALIKWRRFVEGRAYSDLIWCLLGVWCSLKTPHLFEEIR